MSAEDMARRAVEYRESAMGRTPARERMEMLFDDGSFVEADGFASAEGHASGVVCGYGTIMGRPACAFSQDRTEGGGAVGAAHAGKILRLLDMALKTGVPVVGMYDSNGVHVAEGIAALDAYGRMIHRINSLSGVVPQISIVCGTCVGAGATMACCADYLILTREADFPVPDPGAEPDGASDAAASGVACLVTDDAQSAIHAAVRILSGLPLNNLASAPLLESAEPEADAPSDLSPGGPDARGLLRAVFDAGSILELFADFGTSCVTATAALDGRPVGVVATAGAPLDADGCNKIAKAVSVWDAYHLPVITFVDTPGIAADSYGAAREFAKLAHVYAEATAPKISVITGKAYGSAYIALAGMACDCTLAWPSAVLSTLPPETAVAFSHSDRITPDMPREAVVASYIEDEASALAAAQGGFVQDIILPGDTRGALCSALHMLSAKRVRKEPKKHANIPF